MATFETPFACPTCGYRFDLSSGLGHDQAPDEGSFSICIRCATLAMFTADVDNKLDLRPLTPDEWADVIQDFDIAKARSHVLRINAEQ